MGVDSLDGDEASTPPKRIPWLMERLGLFGRNPPTFISTSRRDTQESLTPSGLNTDCRVTC